MLMIARFDKTWSCLFYVSHNKVTKLQAKYFFSFFCGIVIELLLATWETEATLVKVLQYSRYKKKRRLNE